MIAGVNWVTTNHAGRPARGGEHEPRRRRLAPRWTPRWRNSIADGVTYALAAGNDNTNACNSSPARTADGDHRRRRPRAPTRAPRSPTTARCVDLFAPGDGDHVGLVHRATRPPTRSAAPRWPRRTWRARPPCTCRATRARPRRRWRGALIAAATHRQGHEPGHRLAEPAALHRAADRRRHGPGADPDADAHRPDAHPDTDAPPRRAGARAESNTLSGSGASRGRPERHLLPVDRRPARTAAASPGPSGTDFDLALYKWNGGAWAARRQRRGTDLDGAAQLRRAPAGYYRRRLLLEWQRRLHL